MRPWPKFWPFRKIVGTAITWRASTSAWNRPPSIAVWVMRGLTTLIRLSACTMSGQFWHESEKRSEEHTSELQSLMRISYAVFCLKTKKNKKTKHTHCIKDIKLRNKNE